MVRGYGHGEPIRIGCSGCVPTKTADLRFEKQQENKWVETGRVAAVHKQDACLFVTALPRACISSRRIVHVPGVAYQTEHAVD